MSTDSPACLEAVLATLRPRIEPGRFVFVRADSLSGTVEPRALILEAEGACAVVEEQAVTPAESGPHEVLGWITLDVDSSLQLVGLTAAVSTELARVGIACNVLAGLHHDHLLVPIDQLDRAVAVLEALQRHALPRGSTPKGR